MFLAVITTMSLAEARDCIREMARDETYTAAMIFRERPEGEGLAFKLWLPHTEELRPALTRHGLNGGPAYGEALVVVEPVRATGAEAELAREDLRRRMRLVTEEVEVGAVTEYRGDAEVYERDGLQPPPHEPPEEVPAQLLLSFVLRGEEAAVDAATQRVTALANEVSARARARRWRLALEAVARRQAELEAAGEYDWRDELDCDECRAWTGKRPVPVAAVQAMIRELGLEDAEAGHACHMGKGDDGEWHHIPITVLNWEEGRYQWFPELPPGHRPYGAR
jgi:hypothetical protein